MQPMAIHGRIAREAVTMTGTSVQKIHEERSTATVQFACPSPANLINILPEVVREIKIQSPHGREKKGL